MAPPETVFRRCAAAFQARDATLYFDLSPLLEAHWTGIPIVAAGFARALLDVLPQHTRFFSGYDLIASAAVDDALRRNTGLFLDRDIDRGYARAGKLPVFSGAGMSVGFFPSVKPLRVRRGAERVPRPVHADDAADAHTRQCGAPHGSHSGGPRQR
jgi:hypothetical protein